jgi:hypothetical protein
MKFEPLPKGNYALLPISHRVASQRGNLSTACRSGSPTRAKVADELAVMLRDQPYHVRCLLARSRRLARGLPTVWDAFHRGDLDADQIRVIDRTRRVTETSTLAAIDEQAVEAAQTRSPKQLGLAAAAGSAAGTIGLRGAAPPRSRRPTSHRDTTDLDSSRERNSSS